MSFKLGRFFNLTISFIVGSFFFILGGFGVILPWSAHLQHTTSQFILKNTLILSLFGLGFVLIGFSIIIYTFLKTRRRYIQIRTGDLQIVLDKNVIHQSLETYWEKHFPSTHIPFQLNLNKHSLEIIAEMPSFPIAEQKILLEEIKRDFIDLFGRVLGYPYNVSLIASFQDTSKST
ncbi:MAG: hypothetical protein ACH350_04445 [Parachlamydiaceae bacterium]